MDIKRGIMNNKKYSGVKLFVVFVNIITTISTQTTVFTRSSECPCEPHSLACTVGNVVVIQYAYYGFTPGCVAGYIGSGCVFSENTGCCESGRSTNTCLKSFTEKERNELEKQCSKSSSCNFHINSEYKSFTCNVTSFDMYSYSVIDYTCEPPGTTTIKPVSIVPSSTKKPVDTSTQYDGGNDKVDASKDKASTAGEITSSEIAGIVLGAIAIVISLCIAAFLVYLRYEITKSRQSEQNRQQSTNRTFDAQKRKSDYTDITTSPNITTSSSDTTYSQLNRLGSEPVQYGDLIMNNNNRNSMTNNSNGYYNQQYVI